MSIKALKALIIVVIIAKGPKALLIIGPKALKPACKPAIPALWFVLFFALFNTVSLEAFAAASKGPANFLNPGISPATFERAENHIVDLSNFAESSAKEPNSFANPLALSLAADRFSTCFSKTFA